MRIKGIDGQPVIDAKQSVNLTITAADIAKADTKQPANCAAARACVRQLHVEARVHLGRVYLKTTKGNWQRFITPKSLRTEIIAFDRGGQFSPGTYVLQAPNPAVKLGQHQGAAKWRKGTGKKRRASPHIVTDVRNGPA